MKNDLRAKLGKIENDQKDTDKPKVKVKKFEPPKFEGNLRDYPAFKEDYKNLVKVRMVLIRMLLKCVSVVKHFRQ